MTSQQRLTFPGTTAGLADAGQRLRAFLDTIALTPSRRYQVELTFDEIAGNIIRHGRPASDVDVAIAIDGPEIVMTFDDDGELFDPRTHTPRPLDSDLLHAHLGGLGLRMVRTFASRFDYEQTAERRNRLTIAIPHS